GVLLPSLLAVDLCELVMRRFGQLRVVPLLAEQSAQQPLGLFQVSRGEGCSRQFKQRLWYVRVECIGAFELGQCVGSASEIQQNGAETALGQGGAGCLLHLSAKFPFRGGVISRAEVKFS